MSARSIFAHQWYLLQKEFGQHAQFREGRLLFVIRHAAEPFTAAAVRFVAALVKLLINDVRLIVTLRRRHTDFCAAARDERPLERALQKLPRERRLERREQQIRRLDELCARRLVVPTGTTRGARPAVRVAAQPLVQEAQEVQCDVFEDVQLRPVHQAV